MKFYRFLDISNNIVIIHCYLIELLKMNHIIEYSNLCLCM